MPRPPKRVGIANNCLSLSPGVSRPVNAGIRQCLIASSSGWKRSPIPATVHSPGYENPSARQTMPESGVSALRLRLCYVCQAVDLSFPFKYPLFEVLIHKLSISQRRSQVTLAFFSDIDTRILKDLLSFSVVISFHHQPCLRRVNEVTILRAMLIEAVSPSFQPK